MAWLFNDRWAAGFFDGEGNVSLLRRARRKSVEYDLYVQVTQKAREPLDQFRGAFGGNISPTKTPSGCWRWRIHGKQAQVFLERMLPFSLVKKQQIVLALEFRSTVGSPGKRITEEWIEPKRLELSEKIRAEKRRECG